MQLAGEFGVSGNVVLRLIQNLNAANNFKVFFDSWFSSVGLVECLKQKKDMDSWHHSSQSFERLQTANRSRAKKTQRSL